MYKVGISSSSLLNNLMLLFYEWLNEEVIRNINLTKAIERSGISGSVLQHAKGVMTINQFIESPPPNIDGGYALGLTKNPSGVHDIYWHLAAQHLKEPDVTHKFLGSLSSKNVVFFVPSSPSDLGRYTREELEYFTKNPEKASNVYFVFGSYDMISPEDYENQIVRGRTPGSVHTLMQSIISQPGQHKKPEEY